MPTIRNVTIPITSVLVGWRKKRNHGGCKEHFDNKRVVYYWTSEISFTAALEDALDKKEDSYLESKENPFLKFDSQE